MSNHTDNNNISRITFYQYLAIYDGWFRCFFVLFYVGNTFICLLLKIEVMYKVLDFATTLRRFRIFRRILCSLLESDDGIPTIHNNTHPKLNENESSGFIETIKKIKIFIISCIKKF